MATTARARRQSAPKADTKAEVSATPTGLKARLARAAAIAKSAVVRAASAVKAKVVAVVAARPSLATATKRVRSFASKLWHRSLKPLARAAMFTGAVVGMIAALVVAPLATAIGCVIAAALFLLIAKGLRRLEAAEAAGSRAAKIALDVIDIFARTVWALAHVAGLAFTAALCVASVPFAIFVALDVVLSYFMVRGATSIAFVAFCIIGGHWALLAAWIVWRVIRGGRISERTEFPHNTISEEEVTSDPVWGESTKRAAATSSRFQEDDVSAIFDAVDASIPKMADDAFAKKRDVRPSDAPNNPELWTRGDHLTAKGTEELWGTEHDIPPATPEEVSAVLCAACGEEKSGLLPSRHREGDAVRGILICEECYAAETQAVHFDAEARALRHTGVSLKARSCEVRLNQAGVEASDAYALSRAVASGDARKLTDAQREKLAASNWVEGDDAGVWLPVAWWRDKRGHEHAREFWCLHDGKEVARVVHVRKRNVYNASIMGEMLSLTWPTADAARRAVNRQLRDAEASVSRKVTRFSELAGVLSNAAVASKGA